MTKTASETAKSKLLGGNMKSKRSKACDIPQKIKKIVWERDGERCIICGSRIAMPNAHYIPRSKGGLGIEQNIVTLCQSCHYSYDFGGGETRENLGKSIEKYLIKKYPDWNKENLIFRR